MIMLSSVVLAMMSLWACAPQKPSDVRSTHLEVEESPIEEDEEAVVVARVQGEEISLAEFERRIEGLAPFARVRLQSGERRQEFLRSLVQFEVMADEAERRGYGDRTDVRHAIKETMTRMMMAEFLGDEVSLHDIDDQALEDYFQRNREAFSRSEERRLAMVWVEDEEGMEQLLARWQEKAEAGIEEPMREFQQFAFRHSQHRETGDRGGDLGWVVEKEAELFEEVYGAEPGVLMDPVEKSGGWALRMVVEVREATDPSFEEVESEVRNRLLEERRDVARRALIDELSDEVEIEVFEDRLAELEPPVVEIPLQLDELPRVRVGDE